jgi:hypothetical protein
MGQVRMVASSLSLDLIGFDGSEIRVRLEGQLGCCLEFDGLEFEGIMLISDAFADMSMGMCEI